MCPKPRKRGTKSSRDLYLERLSCPIPKENQDFLRKTSISQGSSHFPSIFKSRFFHGHPTPLTFQPFHPDLRINIPGKTTIQNKTPEQKPLNCTLIGFSRGLLGNVSNQGVNWDCNKIFHKYLHRPWLHLKSWDIFPSWTRCQRSQLENQGLRVTLFPSRNDQRGFSPKSHLKIFQVNPR